MSMLKTGQESELRQDITNGEWVVIATGRAQRPDDFKGAARTKKVWPAYKADCPFCALDRFPQGPDVLRLPDDPERWQVHVFPNKYPALQPAEEFRSWHIGPYPAVEAVGYHEVVAARDHNAVDGLASQQQLLWQVEALWLRYRQLKEKQSVNYIQIIKNHGEAAGGSLEHPHHQIFTVPVLPEDVERMLKAAEVYWHHHGRDPFSVMLEYEREQGKRVVFENEHFTAFCPFASRLPFQVWIMPRRPNPYFEDSGPEERTALAEALQVVLGRLYVGLNDPPYNYYLHSAPCDDTGFTCDRATFRHFRWHVEILPRLAKLGGFEMGTGLEINPIWPEEAADFLRAPRSE